MAIQRGTRRVRPEHTLTGREREVLALLAGGVTSDQELCERLYVSPNTVKYHISNLFSKLGLHNRAQLVAYALGQRADGAPPTERERPPLDHASRGQIAADHTSAALRTRPRILVADDDEATLELMAELLVDEGEYEVVAYRLDSEVRHYIRRELPDLLILDLLDSGRRETGWHTLELLRLDPDTNQIPVILCSAAAAQLEEHRERVDKLGVEVLAKPFDIDELLARVRQALGAGQVYPSCHGDTNGTAAPVASNRLSPYLPAGTNGS